jgi:hypothetical protein
MNRPKVRLPLNSFCFCIHLPEEVARLLPVIVIHPGWRAKVASPTKGKSSIRSGVLRLGLTVIIAGPL